MKNKINIDINQIVTEEGVKKLLDLIKGHLEKGDEDEAFKLLHDQLVGVCSLGVEEVLTEIQLQKAVNTQTNDPSKLN